MNIFLIILGVLLILGLAFYIYQHYELRQYRITEYSIDTGKLNSAKKIVMLSDFHCTRYEARNKKMLEDIRSISPDMIILAGDMITTNHIEAYDYVLEYIRRLSEIAPVFYGYGNHEMAGSRKKCPYHKYYIEYKSRLDRLPGVRALVNDATRIELGGDEIVIYGLNLGHRFYGKFNKKYPMPARIKTKYNRTVNSVKTGQNAFTIMIAHNPRYTPEYLDMGADLTLCGHYHGGLVCLPGGRSLISPSFELFPKFSAGETTDGQGHHVITSRGIGTHHFNIRVFNRAEVLSIIVK